MNSNQKAAAAKLAEKANELDFKRHYSFGKGGAKSFIDQHRQSRNFSFDIENKTGQDHVIILGLPTYSMYEDDAALKTDLGATAILSNGEIASDGTGALTVSGTDGGRPIDNVLRTMARNPTVLLSMSMTSKLNSGTPETSNYNSQLKTVFVDPYAQNVEQDLPLRKYLSGRSNSPEFVNVDFVSAGFHVQISPENFLLITVKKGTTLSAVFGVGSEDSPAQRTYRDNRQANQILSPIRKALA